MPSVTWTLHKTCNNCDANITLTSELGERFKLSEARKEKDLYVKAQAWVSAHPFGHTEPYPDDIAPYIQEAYFKFRPTDPKFIVKPNPLFYFIKCPVCSSRIYVC